jgi:hypothetical protein
VLDTDTKRRIDTAHDIVVGKVPDPKSQVEQVTIALIYKFMDDIHLRYLKKPSPAPSAGFAASLRRHCAEAKQAIVAGVS